RPRGESGDGATARRGDGAVQRRVYFRGARQEARSNRRHSEGLGRRLQRRRLDAPRSRPRAPPRRPGVRAPLPRAQRRELDTRPGQFLEGGFAMKASCLLFLGVAIAAPAVAQAPPSRIPARAQARTTTVPPNMSYVDNGTIRVGVDLNMGGVITCLSRSSDANNAIWEPSPGSEIAQSYYA